MNPQIPLRPCYKCGIPTNETQSVYGVGHIKCFQGKQEEKRIPLEEVQKFYKDHPLGPEFFSKYFPNGMKAGLLKTS